MINHGFVTANLVDFDPEMVVMRKEESDAKVPTPERLAELLAARERLHDRLP